MNSSVREPLEVWQCGDVGGLYHQKLIFTRQDDDNVLVNYIESVGDNGTIDPYFPEELVFSAGDETFYVPLKEDKIVFDAESCCRDYIYSGLMRAQEVFTLATAKNFAFVLYGPLPREGSMTTIDWHMVNGRLAELAMFIV